VSIIEEYNRPHTLRIFYMSHKMSWVMTSDYQSQAN
jgi:hypothetical protein